MFEHCEGKISTAKQETQSSTHLSRLWGMRFQVKKKEGKFLKIKQVTKYSCPVFKKSSLLGIADCLAAGGHEVSAWLCGGAVCYMLEHSLQNGIPRGPSWLPRWRSGKESAYNAGDPGDSGSVPGSGKSPRGGNGNSLQYFCLEKRSHKQRSLTDYSLWGRKGSDTTKHAQGPFSRQYVCFMTSWLCHKELCVLLKSLDINLANEAIRRRKAREYLKIGRSINIAIE